MTTEHSADDEITPGLEDGEGTGEGTEGSKRAARRRMSGHARTSTRVLRNAKRLLNGAEMPVSEQARCLFAEANTYALLDLADAIREQGRDAVAESPID